MIGSNTEVTITAEDLAADAASALNNALAQPASDERDDAIYRNAKHLQIVLDGLSISATKRQQYQNLITDNLVE